jgi:hypothetical protein
MLGGCRRGDQGVMSLGEGHGEQWSLVECLERRPRGHVTVERDMGINGAWWSAWRGDQGVMSLWRGTWGSPEIGRLETRTRTCRRLLEGI